MAEAIVGLVTLFHVNDFLPSIRSLPYLERTRTQQDASLRAFERKGLVMLEPDYRETPVIQSGRELRHLRRRFVAGGTIAPFLAEPRLIFVPDEAPPKAKWKAEFRRDWPNDSGALPSHAREALIYAIGGATLQVAGVWRNPTVNLQKFANSTWVNVVLSACRSPRAVPGTLIRFFGREQELWAEWQDVAAHRAEPPPRGSGATGGADLSKF